MTDNPLMKAINPTTPMPGYPGTPTAAYQGTLYDPKQTAGYKAPTKPAGKPVGAPAPSVGSANLQELARRAAKEAGIPEDLFMRLIAAESSWNPQAKSGAGAMGLTQLMPGTASGLGVSNPFDPWQNLRGGARYLAQQYKTFGSWDLALAAYNAGPGNVRKYRGIPPFTETKNYVSKILKGWKGGTPAARPMNSGTDMSNTPAAGGGYVPPGGGFQQFIDPSLMANTNPSTNGIALNNDGTIPGTTFGVGDLGAPDSGTPYDDEYNRLTSELKAHEAELATREGNQAQLLQQQADAMRQPGPEMPQMPEEGFFTSKDAGGAFLATALGAILGLKPQDLAMGIQAFQQGKIQRGQAKYQSQVDQAKAKGDQQDREFKALGLEASAAGAGIPAIERLINATANDLNQTANKRGGFTQKRIEQYSKIANDPNATAADKATALVMLKINGYEYPPETWAAVLQDGSNVQRWKAQNKVAQDTLALKVKEHQTKIKQFDQRLKLDRERMAQTRRNHLESLAQSWRKFTQTHEWDLAKPQLGDMQKQYDAALKDRDSQAKDLRKAEIERDSIKAKLALARKNSTDPKAKPSAKRDALADVTKYEADLAGANVAYDSLKMDLDEFDVRLKDLKPPSVPQSGDPAKPATVPGTPAPGGVGPPKPPGK